MGRLKTWARALKVHEGLGFIGCSTVAEIGRSRDRSRLSRETPDQNHKIGYGQVFAGEAPAVPGDLSPEEAPTVGNRMEPGPT